MASGRLRLVPVAVLLFSNAALARPLPSLGPGRGPWLLERPEPFGIPQATMELVAERVHQSMAERYCLLVSLDGHLIHESYFHNRSETRYEADSLAKTMTAQIVGVAVAQGLIDLDKPLAEYGVEPRCPDDDARAAERGWDKSPINSTCAALLKGLCPNFAPPWDSTGRKPGHVTGPLPRSVCTESCTRRNDVRKALWESNCSMTARRWCAPPGPGKGCWIDSQTGVDYWPQVTARHLLTQTTGVGNYPPGTQFTYDSDQYIDHLAYLISKVTNESSQTWATREYALPMGLSPDVFAYGGFVDPVDGNEFSPGGGQMMSCRDHLRIGQLLINKGKWADDEGDFHQPGAQRPYKQLLTEDYVEEFMQPSFPNVSQSYGFLVWLNREVNEDGCCSPRWGGHSWVPSLGISVETCHNTIQAGHQMIGDGMATAERAPRDLALGMGMSAKYSIIVPSQGLVVNSLGLSWSSSEKCPLGNYPLGPNATLRNGSVIGTAGQIANSRGYDDSWSSTMLWRSIGNISALINKSIESDVPLLDSRSHERQTNEAATQATTSSTNIIGDGAGGACYAYCPPMMGFGVCFNMPAGTPPNNCSAVISLAGAVCPAHGNPRQCHTPPIADDTDCESIYLDGKPNCTLVGTGCEMLVGAGQGGLLPPNDAFRHSTCMCHPTEFEEKQLSWTAKPCVYSPYTPPSPVEVPQVERKPKYNNTTHHKVQQHNTYL